MRRSGWLSPDERREIVVLNCGHFFKINAMRALMQSHMNSFKRTHLECGVCKKLHPLLGKKEDPFQDTYISNVKEEINNIQNFPDHQKALIPHGIPHLITQEPPIKLSIFFGLIFLTSISLLSATYYFSKKGSLGYTPSLFNSGDLNNGRSTYFFLSRSHGAF